MLKKEISDTLEHNDFLKARKRKAQRRKFLAFRKGLFIAGIITGVALVLTTYFVSDASRIFHVAVSGNEYISSEEIRLLSEVTEDDLFLFTSCSSIEKKLKESPFISDAQVTKKEGNLIAIEVSEYRLIGYTSLDNVAYFVSDEGQLIEISDDTLSLISRMPLIVGFTEEKIRDIARNFKDLDDNMLSEISEIHRYPFSYDEDMMEMVMKDGNYCFVSRYGLKLLKDYYSVVSKLKLNGQKACLYLDEVTDTYQYRKCPWEYIEE